MTAPQLSLFAPAELPVSDDWDTDQWATPPAIVAACERIVGGRFGFDLAARSATSKAPAFYSPAEDSLAQDWVAVAHEHGRLWLNPPYSNQREWCEKAGRAGRVLAEAAPERRPVICALLKAARSARYWHEWCAGWEEYSPLGRIAFHDAEGRPRPGADFESVVVLFGWWGSHRYVDLARAEAGEHVRRHGAWMRD